MQWWSTQAAHILLMVLLASWGFFSGFQIHCWTVLLPHTSENTVKSNTLRQQKKCPKQEIAAYKNVWWIQSLYESSSKQGFVTETVRRTVCLWNCLLGDKSLFMAIHYSLFMGGGGGLARFMTNNKTFLPPPQQNKTIMNPIAHHAKK